MIRVRFAPSPTGNIHIGNLRGILYNYLFTKKYDGKFILRIEDTDLERNISDSKDGIIEDLKWLKIDIDEGPGIGGDYGPYCQSQRLDIYKKYSEQLIQDGKAHRVYDKKYGENKYAVEVIANNISVDINDEVFGNLTNRVDNFIIMKSNGYPSYNFAVVIDDYLMKITNIIRGQDHIINTHKQIFLYNALGFKSPKFAHYSLTSGLSKRNNNFSIRELRNKGFCREAIINISMLLGWNPRLKSDKFNIMDNIKNFNTQYLSKTNSTFDKNKFLWLSKQYIKELSLNDFLDRFSHFIIKYFIDDITLPNNGVKVLAVNDITSRLKGTIIIAKKSITCADELKYFASVMYNKSITISNSAMDTISKFSLDNNIKVLTIFNELLSTINKNNLEDLDIDIKSILNNIKMTLNIKGKELFLPIRVALTGKTEGIEVNLIAKIIYNIDTIKSRVINLINILREKLNE